MTARDIFETVVWSIAARPWRSVAIAASLAMAVATAAFIGSVTLGFGQELQRLAFGVYAHALVIRENGLIVDRHAPPRLSDVETIAALAGVTGVTTWRKGAISMWTGDKMVSIDVYGVAGPYLSEVDAPIIDGRAISEEETRVGERVCLLGVETARTLGLSSPVGETLRLGGGRCEIVGVLGEPASRPAAQFAEAIIMPFSVAERLTPSEADANPGEAGWITVALNLRLPLQRAEMSVDLALRRLRGAPLSEPSPFVYGNSNASLAQMQEQKDMIARLLLTLGALSLLASMTAYAAIVAAGMEPRRREFAIRLALGADDRAIQAMVLAESLALGLCGAIAGLAIGVGLASLSGLVWGWPFALDWPLAVKTLGLGLAVGVFAGGIMAWRVSKVPPSLAAKS